MKTLRVLLLASVTAACSTTPAPEPPATRASSEARTEHVAAGCERDTHEQLQPVLWAQTSAEFRVLAESTYRMASKALDQAALDRSWTAAPEQTNDLASLPLAVIVDLDETVLDNSRFEAELALRRAPYSQQKWTEWVRMRQASLIPGAKPFLDRTRAKGVAVFFVTNRTVEEEPDTVANLSSLGVAARPDEILAKGENGWPSDKSSRRMAIARDYRIGLLIGDDLGDYLPANLPPEKRVEAALKYSDWWGTRWFLLPNPSYGSWDRALYGFDPNLPDKDQLVQKFARLQGFSN